ncbi:MAG: hypothetical protein R3E97_21645 [Candidatus Eisenbacteria bacterium]
MGDWNSSPSVSSTTLYRGDLVISGGFGSAGGTEARRIARWNGTEWSSFGQAGGSPATVHADGDDL